MSIDSRKIMLAVIFTIIMIMFFIPGILSRYWVYHATRVIIFSLAVLGSNVFKGKTGYMNFGLSFYWGLGHYFVAWACRFLNFDVWSGVLLLFASSLLVSLAVGAFLIRFRSHIFTCITIILSMILFLWGMNTRWLTGGDEGFAFRYQQLTLGNIVVSIHDQFVIYYFSLVMVLLLTYATYKILRSPLGRAFEGIRENEERLRSLGHNTSLIKLAAFTTAGFLICVGGGLNALLEGYTSPHVFHWHVTATMIIAMLIGGMYTIEGAFIGSAIFKTAEDLLSTNFPDIWPIIIGLLIIFFVFWPRGIAGYIHHIYYKRTKENTER